MRLFVSAGEPSGDLHGASLLRAWCAATPASSFTASAATVWSKPAVAFIIRSPILRASASSEFYQASRVPGILQQADRLFREMRPDALVLIDFPAFHWWLAKRARSTAFPSSGSCRRSCGRGRRGTSSGCAASPTMFSVRCRLKRNGIAKGESNRATSVILISMNCTAVRWTTTSSPRSATKPGTIIALLPGSRRQELKHNFAPIIEAARILHVRDRLRFLVACLRPEHARGVEERLRGEKLPIEVHAGRTAEIIHLAHSAIAKSGSVSLEMLYHNTPAVVVYQVPRVEEFLAKRIVKCKYASLVNLLLDKPLFPEYLGHRLPADAIAGSVLHWLEDARLTRR